ncbi:hypothetical protein [Flavobacterium pectinovorum]|uniref:Lipocalin-like domain-containing protein n=1 Tax=Flavobacterium pectinovorum TaxID=29533 RepID=A0A502E811_9FLAO|nr:hypothetical protein [Flavobacterium pectinovorum]TPG33878.1 hypothetical protein EAH81_23290 [Flavobacterium pectinovorum]
MTIKTLSLVVLIFSISCKKTESTPKNFVGTWYDTGFKAENKTTLKILDNNTFLYNGGSSDWTGFSNGSWKIIGDTIELSSTKMEDCYNVSPFSDCNSSDGKNKVTTTIPGCTPDIDVSFVVLNKEKFYMRNDSLIHKSKVNSKCTDKLKISFARTPKSKK